MSGYKAFLSIKAKKKIINEEKLIGAQGKKRYWFTSLKGNKEIIIYTYGEGLILSSKKLIID